MSNININAKLRKFHLRLDDCGFKDLEQRKDNAEELLKYAYQIDDNYGQAYAFLHLAIFYLTYRKFDSAEFNLNKAKSISLKNNFTDLTIQCYRNEGRLYQLKGDTLNAIQSYDKTMRLAEEENDNLMIGVLYNNIACILMDLKDYSFAKDYFENAIMKLNTVDKQNTNLVQVYINLIKICCYMNNSSEAHIYFNKAKEINIENNFVKLVLMIAEMQIHSIDNKVHKVKEILSSTLKIVEEYPNSNSIFTVELISIAENLLLMDMKEDCRYILNKIHDQLNEGDLELELHYQKILVSFQEKYEEIDNDASAKYHYLLMAREKQENNSIAESLRNRIKLFELNQKHSLLLEEHYNLEKQAHLDELTGLYNRRYCDKLLLKISTNLDVKTFGCIMLDVDHFKEYNDTYGHLQGDIILRQVADILSSNCVNGINVGRYGGDEFYCLCSGLTDEEIDSYLTKVLHDLRLLGNEHIMNDAKIVTITAGYYNDEKSKFSLDTIMNYADQALYIAKENGRNNFFNYKNKYENN